MTDLQESEVKLVIVKALQEYNNESLAITSDKIEEIVSKAAKEVRKVVENGN
jgi:hypothetical protein